MQIFVKRTEGSGSNGKFIKLASDESITGILMGDHVEFYKIFKDPKDYPINDAPPEGGKFRFKINMIVTEDKAYVAKILEGGAQIFNAISDLQDAGYNLEETVVKLSRKGSGKDNTKYSLVTTPIKLTDVQIANIKKVPLNLLSSVKVHDHAFDDFSQGTDNNSDIPF